MARILTAGFVSYLKSEERMVKQCFSGQKHFKRALNMYEKIKVTPKDLSRIYSAKEVRMLCQRTKVKVDMTAQNCVWDAKKYLDKKKCLVNRSESFINDQIERAVNEKKVVPYSDKDVAIYTHIVRCETKKDNNARLKRWRRKERTPQKTLASPRRSKRLLRPPLSPDSPLQRPEYLSPHGKPFVLWESLERDSDSPFASLEMQIKREQASIVDQLDYSMVTLETQKLEPSGPELSKPIQYNPILIRDSSNLHLKSQSPIAPLETKMEPHQPILLPNMPSLF